MQRRNEYLLRATTDAMMIALFAVLSIFATIKIPNLVEISWSSLPIFLAAYLFGLPDALLVALGGSFLEQLCGAYGLSPTTPLWMMPVILQALFVGLLAPLSRKKHGKVIMVVTIVASEFLLTFCNTVALYLDARIMHYTVKALAVLLPARLINGSARAVLSAVVVPAILISVEKAVGKRRHAPGKQDVDDADGKGR